MLNNIIYNSTLCVLPPHVGVFVCVYATGVTVSVFSDLPLSLCIWISAAVAIIYTVLGGLYSVAFTDVVQLSLVFCSLAS